MSKIAIVYIGPKETKKDTIAGSRQVFPRFKPIEVEEAVAANLLRYPTVFVEAEKLEEIQKQQEEAEAAKAEAAELAAKQAEEEKVAADFNVVVEGEEYDLSKMNCSKIATLLESADIKLEAKGAQESAPDYKVRVRDAIRALESDGE